MNYCDSLNISLSDILNFFFQANRWILKLTLVGTKYKQSPTRIVKHVKKKFRILKLDHIRGHVTTYLVLKQRIEWNKHNNEKVSEG